MTKRKQRNPSRFVWKRGDIDIIKRANGPAPKYRDCASEAIRYLGDDSTLNLEGATAEPDPQVNGVWKVTTPNDVDVEFAIVYLAGYHDPLGNIRDVDDFECCHRDDDGTMTEEVSQ